jgi:hypothetical protein
MFLKDGRKMWAWPLFCRALVLGVVCWMDIVLTKSLLFSFTFLVFLELSQSLAGGLRTCDRNPKGSRKSRGSYWTVWAFNGNSVKGKDDWRTKNIRNPVLLSLEYQYSNIGYTLYPTMLQMMLEIVSQINHNCDITHDSEPIFTHHPFVSLNSDSGCWTSAHIPNINSLWRVIIPGLVSTQVDWLTQRIILLRANS